MTIYRFSSPDGYPNTDGTATYTAIPHRRGALAAMEDTRGESILSSEPIIVRLPEDQPAALIVGSRRDKRAGEIVGLIFEAIMHSDMTV